MKKSTSLWMLFFEYILLTSLLCFISCVAERKPDNAFAPDLPGEAEDSIGYSLFVDSIRYIPAGNNRRMPDRKDKGRVYRQGTSVRPRRQDADRLK